MSADSRPQIEPGNGRRVLVAMSGGVDSSVAAALLVDAGYEVVGCFMRLGSPGESLDEMTPDAGEACASGTGARPLKIGHQGCCSVGDAADARLVAAQLGIPLYVVNFKRDFDRIIDYFVDEYARGRTPNPCVRCNDWLKFGKLHEYAEQIGAGAVASGHYARVEPRGGRPALLRGVDHAKDQSYVLFGVAGSQLASMMLPIGSMPKDEVRALAERLGLPVFDKPDSYEICFVPDNDYAGLVERRRPELAREGVVLSREGEPIGTHGGQHRFTVGQRRGIGIARPEPLYVLNKDPEANTVTVGPAEDLVVPGVTVAEMNWLSPEPARGERVRAIAQYRAHGRAAEGAFEIIDAPERFRGGPCPSGRTGWMRFVFDEPQRGVAPGQAMVLYDLREPGRVIAGGWIAEADPG